MNLILKLEWHKTQISTLDLCFFFFQHWIYAFSISFRIKPVFAVPAHAHLMSLKKSEIVRFSPRITFNSKATVMFSPVVAVFSNLK